ncbi:hypothetical protein [Nocardiopsis protaetiae]|uniref:hypothetical protein n=1 Tax=Nocardiopsis protaetiae TaxID=3382270 RepID=UPI00387B17CF
MSDLARLEHITKNLDDHIQARAEQVAAPRIAEAQEAAEKRVRGLELDLKVAEQRRDDLRQEYRRQIASLERQRDRAREDGPDQGAWGRLKDEIPRLYGRESAEALPHDSEYATALHDVLAAMKRIENARAVVGEQS